jgi:ABC-type nitrate/sulfonate/bicarbonate transport system substrate-binding protein
MDRKEACRREPKHLRVGVFNGAWNLPIWIAQSRGFFAASDLDVEVLPTKSSGALMLGLYGHDIEIALAGADNFLAYEAGMGEVDISRDDELRIVMGGDGGFLKLVSQAPYESVGQLSGKSIGVDALTTGFAFVVREVLRRNMITEASVAWVPLGGTETRYAALLANKCDATLLRLPYDLMAQAAGANILASSEELGPYQGTVAAVRRGWAAEHSERLVAFIRGYARGLQWCSESSNRRTAIEELQKRLRVPNDALASGVLDKLFSPGGLQMDLRVDLAGLATVIELRERYAAGGRPMRNPGHLIDETFLRSAGVLVTN